MKQQKNTDLSVLSLKELVAKLNEVRGELFKIQFQSTTQPSSSYGSSRRLLKRSVARILTHLRQRVEQEISGLAQS